MNELLELWFDFYERRYPKGYGGVEINQVWLTLLDSDAAGCISTYIKNEENQLDLERILVLQQCKGDCELIFKELNDEALDYFALIHRMCELVLSEAEVV